VLRGDRRREWRREEIEEGLEVQREKEIGIERGRTEWREGEKRERVRGTLIKKERGGWNCGRRGGITRVTDFLSTPHNKLGLSISLLSGRHLITAPLSSSNLFTMSLSLSLSLPPCTCPWHSICPSPSLLYVGVVSRGRTESPGVREG
jgi:hypothetical protein